MAKTMQTASTSTGGTLPCTKMVVIEVANPADLVKGDIFSFVANFRYNKTWTKWTNYQCTVPETKDGRPPSIIRINIPVSGDLPTSAKVEVKDVKVVKKHSATKDEVSSESIIESITPSECQGLFPRMYQENLSEAEKFQRQVNQVRCSVVARGGLGAPPSPKPPASSAPSESQGMRHELLSLRSTKQTLTNTVNDLRESNEALTKQSSMDAGTIKELKTVNSVLQKRCDERRKALAAKECELRELGQKLVEKEQQLANSRCETDSASFKRSMSSLCSTEGNKKRMRAFLHPDKLSKEDQSAAKTVRDILKL